MRWQPGQSGNPGGRPRRGRSATEVMQKLAAAKREGQPMSRVEEMCLKLLDLAIGGDVAAIKLALEYLDGRPVERVQAQVTALPPFSADEAAEAERRLREFRARLAGPAE